MRPTRATPTPIPALAATPRPLVEFIDAAVGEVTGDEPVVLEGIDGKVVAATVAERVDTVDSLDDGMVLSEMLKKMVQSSGSVAPVLYKLMMKTFEMAKSIEVETVHKKLVMLNAFPSAW